MVLAPRKCGHVKADTVHDADDLAYSRAVFASFEFADKADAALVELGDFRLSVAELLAPCSSASASPCLGLAGAGWHFFLRN